MDTENVLATSDTGLRTCKWWLEIGVILIRLAKNGNIAETIFVVGNYLAYQ